MDDDEYDDADDQRFKRKRNVPRHGDTAHFPMTLQDGHIAMTDMVAAKPSSSAVVDGLGQAAGHRPGYCFTGDAAARDQAVDLHEANKRRLEGLWRKRRKKRTAPQPSEGAAGQRNRGGTFPPPVGGDGAEDEQQHSLDADKLRAQADQAWRDRCFRMQNAWKGQTR